MVPHREPGYVAGNGIGSLELAGPLAAASERVEDRAVGADNADAGVHPVEDRETAVAHGSHIARERQGRHAEVWSKRECLEPEVERSGQLERVPSPRDGEGPLGVRCRGSTGQQEKGQEGKRSGSSHVSPLNARSPILSCESQPARVSRRPARPSGLRAPHWSRRPGA